MQKDTAAEYLIGKLKEQRSVAVNNIVDRDISDSDYKRLRGVVQGIDYAIDLIIDTANRVANDEELISHE